jgi:putative transposase
MPRTARSLVAGGHYHLINRGNDRSVVFHQPSDYQAFLRMIELAQQEIRLTLLAVCLMPNHFHIVVSQDSARDISRWMQWLLTTHTHRHHLRYRTSGRVWQGRFKAFPIEQDDHLLTVMRYVERNALRAGLVKCAEQWPWGSLAWRMNKCCGPPLAEPPIPLPSDWGSRVNGPQSPAELQALRTAVNRQQPYGDEAWIAETAELLGLQSSRRGPGRPRKLQE